MNLDPEQPFVELCCGSGAVSLELISRGHNPAKITMVDAGPWGDVWRLVGAGEFDLLRMENWLQAVPQEAEPMLRWFHEIRVSVSPDSPDGPYVFLILQAANFGGSPVGKHGGKWTGAVSHAARCIGGEVTPRLNLIRSRLPPILRRTAGVRGVCGKAEECAVPSGAAIYFDPPYAGLEGYRSEGQTVEAATWQAILAHGVPTYVSEAVHLRANSRPIQFRKASSMNAKSNVSGAEVLSLFNADWPTPDYERVEQIALF